MHAYKNIGPAIAKGWLRALTFTIFYLLLLLALGTGIGLLSKGNISEQLRASLLPYSIVLFAVVSMLFVWGFVRFIDRKSFKSLGFQWKEHQQHAGAGFSLAVFMLCAGTLVLFAFSTITWTGVAVNVSQLLTGLGFMVIVAVYEETVFRGYILNNLMQSMNRWYALVISAVIFFLAHGSNPSISIVALINIFIAGILLGLNYIYTRNLWFGIFFHFGWNFLQGPVLGYEVSGVVQQSVLEQEVRGNALISGGSFGFEGSLVATGLLLAGIAALSIVYKKRLAVAQASV